MSRQQGRKPAELSGFRCCQARRVLSETGPPPRYTLPLQDFREPLLAPSRRKLQLEIRHGLVLDGRRDNLASACQPHSPMKDLLILWHARATDESFDPGVSLLFLQTHANSIDAATDSCADARNGRHR